MIVRSQKIILCVSVNIFNSLLLYITLLSLNVFDVPQLLTHAKVVHAIQNYIPVSVVTKSSM